MTNECSYVYVPHQTNVRLNDYDISSFKMHKAITRFPPGTFCNPDSGRIRFTL